MSMAMAISTAASSLLLSPPPTLLTDSPQLAQQLHLPKTSSSKWTPLVLTTSHSTLEKTMPTTSRSTNCPNLSFLSLTTPAIDTVAMVCPSLACTHTLYFKSGFNLQINVKENEPEETILFRFKKAVIRARVLQECKRRFFESAQDKKKRKTRDADRRNSKRRPQPRTPVNPRRRKMRMTMTTGNSQKERFPIADCGKEVHKRKPDSSCNEKERMKDECCFQESPN